MSFSIPHDKNGPLAGWARLFGPDPSCNCSSRPEAQMVCLRWGHFGADDQCLLLPGHLGPCVTKQGQTLPLYYQMPRVTK